MSPEIYRYRIESQVEMPDVQAVLAAAVEAVEHLHGEAAARLDARYYFDEGRRCIVLDAATPIGLALNKLFAGGLAREFGPDSFQVERVAQNVGQPPIATCV